MIQQKQAIKVDGSYVLTSDGVWQKVIGDQIIAPNGYVWADGHVVYGHIPQRGGGTFFYDEPSYNYLYHIPGGGIFGLSKDFKAKRLTPTKVGFGKFICGNNGCWASDWSYKNFYNLAGDNEKITIKAPDDTALTSLYPMDACVADNGDLLAIYPAMGKAGSTDGGWSTDGVMLFRNAEGTYYPIQRVGYGSERIGRVKSDGTFWMFYTEYRDPEEYQDADVTSPIDFNVGEVIAVISQSKSINKYGYPHTVTHYIYDKDYFSTAKIKKLSEFNHNGSFPFAGMSVCTVSGTSDKENYEGVFYSDGCKKIPTYHYSNKTHSVGYILYDQKGVNVQYGEYSGYGSGDYNDRVGFTVPLYLSTDPENRDVASDGYCFTAVVDINYKDFLKGHSSDSESTETGAADIPVGIIENGGEIRFRVSGTDSEEAIDTKGLPIEFPSNRHLTSTKLDGFFINQVDKDKYLIKQDEKLSLLSDDKNETIGACPSQINTRIIKTRSSLVKKILRNAAKLEFSDS